MLKGKRLYDARWGYVWVTRRRNLQQSAGAGSNKVSFLLAPVTAELIGMGGFDFPGGAYIGGQSKV